MPLPTTPDLLREIDLLRAAVRLSMTTIRKLHRGQKVHVAPILGKLGSVRAEAGETAKALRTRRKAM